jgi:hypothetical protein
MPGFYEKGEGKGKRQEEKKKSFHAFSPLYPYLLVSDFITYGNSVHALTDALFECTTKRALRSGGSPTAS